MELVAERERLAPEVVRAEVARGGMIVSANVHHADWRAGCSASLVPRARRNLQRMVAPS